MGSEMCIRDRTLSASVIPKRLLDDGFVFDYPDVDSAMKELIG